LLAILLTLLVGDLLGTIVVQNRFARGAQRETANQAKARAQQVQSLYTERATTLETEGEAISLYPAVKAALVGNNPAPLRTWSAQVANLQGTSVTVTDANGNVVARGLAPDHVGDDLSSQLLGLRLALQGTRSSGTEAGDELGLALRGYTPVLQGGLSGPIVGAVMIAEPLNERFLNHLVGGDAAGLNMRVDTAKPITATQCAAPVGVSAVCSVPLVASDGSPTGNLSFEVLLADIERAQSDAQSGLWLASAVVLVLGAAVGLFLELSK
jgi:sensor histidine kinase regulating citrate/malate metabolism